MNAAFFDLDDTLCDDSAAWVECARAAATLAARKSPDIDPERLAAVFLEISERYWLSPEVRSEKRPIFDIRVEQWREAMTLAGTDYIAGLAEVAAEDYGRRRSTEIELFPGTIDVLEQMRSRGYCLVLITNGLAMTHTEKVEHLGLERLVDHIVIADEFGHFKPDPRIFHHALQLCGCDASEAIMVGDDLCNDIAGAEAVGIKSYWFNPKRKELPIGAVVPSGGQIAQLSELLSIV